MDFVCRDPRLYHTANCKTTRTKKNTPKNVYASIARIYMCAQCDRIDCVANRICSQLKTERRSMFRGQADRPQLHWHSNFHGGIDGIGMLWMMAVRWSTAIEHTHAGWKPSRFAWKCSGEAVAMLESFFDLQMKGPVWLSCYVRMGAFLRTAFRPHLWWCTRGSTVTWQTQEYSVRLMACGGWHRVVDIQTQRNDRGVCLLSKRS